MVWFLRREELSTTCHIVLWGSVDETFVGLNCVIIIHPFVIIELNMNLDRGIKTTNKYILVLRGGLWVLEFSIFPVTEVNVE